MIPLIAGLAGLVLGLLGSPNATVGLICGAFFAAVAWALTGFRVGGAKGAPVVPRDKPRYQPAKESKAEVSENGSPNSSEPQLGIPPQPVHGVNWAMVRVFLIVAAVLFAANYKRCTELPDERQRKNASSTEMLINAAREESYGDCVRAGESEGICEQAGDRAADLAKKKTETMFGR